MNKLIVIGSVGDKRAYLNVSRDEAIRRYMADADDPERPDDLHIEELTFNDEFCVYDAWGI